MDKATKFLLMFTAVHAAISTFIFAGSFALAMARFDSGANPAAIETTLQHVSQILFFPLVTLLFNLDGAVRFFPGLLGWIPIFYGQCSFGGSTPAFVDRLALLGKEARVKLVVELARRVTPDLPHGPSAFRSCLTS